MCATDKGWACDWWARYTRKRVVPCLEAAARPTLVRLFNGDGRLDAVAINLVLKAPRRRKKRGLHARPIFTETGSLNNV